MPVTSLRPELNSATPMNKAFLLLLLVPKMVLAQVAVAPTPAILRAENGSSNGPSVDRAGAPVVDPTKNVLDLVTALEKRLDDIDKLNNKRADDKFKSVQQVIDLEAKITDMHALYNADFTKLRAEYQMQLDQKESNRIDAIRKVDQEAVRNESDRSQQAVNTLAAAQAATAETLRSAVNTTATNIATQLDRTTSAIVERISALEKVQYTGQGRAGVADPQVEALRADVARLSSVQLQGTGKAQGFESSWGILVAAISVIGVFVVVLTRRTNEHRNN